MTHWLVKHLFAQAKAQGISIRDLERRAGLGTNTIHRWQYRDPSLPKLEKALLAVGLRLRAADARADGGANIHMKHTNIAAPKACPDCGRYAPYSAVECEGCGYVFKKEAA